jgi:hypothetical protein
VPIRVLLDSETLLSWRKTMTAAQFEELEAPEVEAVLRWRFEEFIQAGFDVGSAMIHASHVEIDLHEVTLLIARGCPPETAMQIVL